MKPVDMQPAIFQTPNVERIQQEQVSRPQVSQQIMAAEAEKIGSERPGQVQAPEAQSGPREPEMLSEDRGERRKRRVRSWRPGGSPTGRVEETSGNSGSPEGASVDILV